VATADLFFDEALSVEYYWLALKFVPRLAVHKKLALIHRLGIKGVFQHCSSLASYGLTQKQIAAIQSPNWQKIEQTINDSLHCNSVLIPFEDPRYPAKLKEIYDPPLVLFAQGNLALFQQTQIAIVGSRNASVNGRENAFELAKQLAQEGLVVTSGLALGVDGAAHKGALEVSGRTIAVVATGLDKVYPARHKILATDIIKAGGLILSEFLPGTSPKPGHFPKRNRIISGLSEGVVVVEATIRSGSLVTARCAIEQNREVFAVPGSILNPQSKGCHYLIKQGAKLIENSADIIDELINFEKNSLNLKIDSDIEEESKKSPKEDLCNDPLLASVGYEITPVDIVISRCKLPIDVVLTRLTMFELRGLVSAVPGGYLRIK
jgi:DNA processing protein